MPQYRAEERRDAPGFLFGVPVLLAIGTSAKKSMFGQEAYYALPYNPNEEDARDHERGHDGQG